MDAGFHKTFWSLQRFFRTRRRSRAGRLVHISRRALTTVLDTFETNALDSSAAATAAAAEGAFGGGLDGVLGVKYLTAAPPPLVATPRARVSTDHLA